MDLVSDYYPISEMFPGMVCESDYHLLSDFIRVTRLYTLPFPGTGHSRFPLFFRKAFPYLTPPDRFIVEDTSVRVEWVGKIIKLSQESTRDELNREYFNNCPYSIPPSSVSIHFSCCGMDQIYIEAKSGNKQESFVFYKLPYLPILLLHASNVVELADCEMSTKNTDIAFINRDSYSLYDFLMLIYHWRITCSSSTVDPISVFTQAIAEPDIAHNTFTLGCYRCEPSPPSTVMTSEIFYDLANRTYPWVCNVPIDEILIGYNIAVLGQMINPFLGMLVAFQPMPNYWTLVYTKSPDDPDNFPADFYLIHANMLVKSSCGDIDCFALIDYDTDFIPSLECINFEGSKADTVRRYPTTRIAPDGRVNLEEVIIYINDRELMASNLPGGNVPSSFQEITSGDTIYSIHPGEIVYYNYPTWDEIVLNLPHRFEDIETGLITMSESFRYQRLNTVPRTYIVLSGYRWTQLNYTLKDGTNIYQWIQWPGNITP
jgi:hypothetical protein